MLYGTMVTERVEFKLDPERRRKLSKLATLRKKPLSEVFRQMIDKEYEQVEREERMAAARRLGELEVEDVPDPETLKRQLDETHDLPDLH